MEEGEREKLNERDRAKLRGASKKKTSPNHQQVELNTVHAPHWFLFSTYGRLLAPLNVVLHKVLWRRQGGSLL